MEYKFNEIEGQVKNFWKGKNIYKTGDAETGKPKFYVLDMFPYPSGAGLHVGHPLGYIASDIYARYKRMKGFNVLHPMGMDSFGLPAEQYAIQTGQHPAITTEQNIATFKKQMDQLGFSFDWSREVRTSDPKFYKWTQWIFIQLFHSWYNNVSNKAEKIDSLIAEFEKNGNANVNAACGDFSNLYETNPLLRRGQGETFSAADWENFSAKQKSDVLLNYRLAFIADSWVNWCPALGTVLANDEVKDGVSERGGYPVERKLMKQWSLRITAYSERLLQGLNELDWSDSIKEAQRNWIGKSEGASVKFQIARNSSPLFERGVRGEVQKEEEKKTAIYQTANPEKAAFLIEQARRNRKNQTEAEEILWAKLRNQQLGTKFRRQHYIGNYIADFADLYNNLIVEVDGELHNDLKELDAERTKYLNEQGFTVIRFWNTEVITNTENVIEKIKSKLHSFKDIIPNPSLKEKGTVADNSAAPEISIEVFTTRPDTIFGVTFLTLAPEHELISLITTDTQRKAVEEYVAYAKNRSERERMTDVKKITGVFSGAYAVHPFSGKQIPIWIGEYVLAGYGTGAVMGVPGHDSRDYGFAKHFNLEIIEVVAPLPTSSPGGEEKAATKSLPLGEIGGASFEEEGTSINSDFLNGLKTAEAKQKAIDEIEKAGIGERKINYKQRDAIFGRQRYWGEPIPVYYDEDGIPHTVDESDLPVQLPEVDKYLPTEDGEPPLARSTNWKYFPRISNAASLSFGEGSDVSEVEKQNDLPPHYLTANPDIANFLVENARKNRKDPTEAEKLLWERVRDSKLGTRIRRQHYIESFIGDFVALNEKLVIELDGEQHKQNKDYDAARTKYLNELGYSVIRFWNDEVLKQTNDTIQKIKLKLDEQRKILIENSSATSPTSVPLSKGEGSSVRVEGSSEYFKRSSVGYSLETTTMPGWAGSSWYFLRYEDPNNENGFASKDAINYWRNVDFYIGGYEHATGHLIYFRFWTKFLFDLGLIPFDEPAKRLVNQGMIQGVSLFLWRDKNYKKIYSYKSGIESITNITSIHFPIEYCDEKGRLFFSELKKYTEQYEKSYGHLNIENDVDWQKDEKDNRYILLSPQVEKMSKSKYNVVNPEDIVSKYGADCFRLYEMFLGPIEMSKPWDTKGIDGVSRFLRKLWKLFFDENNNWIVTDETASNEELKILHKTIKKVEDDMEKLSYNTSVSAFMICVNTLTDLKCHKREMLKDLLLIMAPFAPFTTEFLWREMKEEGSVVTANFPEVREDLLVENSFEYPVAVNGKTKTKISFPLDKEIFEIEKEVIATEALQKYFDGKSPRKVIVVKGRMINVVV